MNLESELNIKINVLPHLVHLDPKKVQVKILSQFKTRVTKFKDHYDDKESFK